MELQRDMLLALGYQAQCLHCDPGASDITGPLCDAKDMLSKHTRGPVSLVVLLRVCPFVGSTETYCQVAGIYFNQVDTEMTVTKEGSDPQKEEAWPALQDHVGKHQGQSGGRGRGQT